MAINKKITECTELTTAPAADDLLPIVDVSDTTDAASGTTKKQQWLNSIKHLFGSRFAEDAGASDTYTATLVPTPTAYITGEHYRFKANTANTGACTINFNSLGAKTIKKVAGGITTDLTDNDIRAGQWVDLVYDGTNMQMQSLLGNVPSGGTPGAHASTHQNGGADEVDVTGLSGVLADPQVPITENVQDIVAALLVAGTNITITYNDPAGTLTIDSTGGGSIAPLVIEDANTVAQRNSTNAQKLRVHKTFTSSTNFEALALYSSGGDYFVEAEKGSGGGSFQILRIGGQQIVIRTPIGGSTLQNNWDINSNADGAILPATTKAYDIGSPSKYVRNIFSLNTPKRLASNFTKTGDTTLADVTGLSREIQSGKRYRFEADLYFDADATGGHKYAIAASGGAPTNLIFQIVSIDNGTPNNNLISSRQTTSGGSAGQASATAGYTRIVGFIRAGADGNLTVQFAQNAASGSSSLLAGSTFSVECLEN